MKNVIGTGNALVDILIKVKDDFLKQLNFQKGSMVLIDANKTKEILEIYKGEVEKSTGGSVANTIKGLAKLGVKASYIGKTGDDEFGDFFKDYLNEMNVDVKLLKGKSLTGQSTVMISEDSERTMATHLGAAIELKAEELEEDFYKGFDYSIVEGYLVQDHNLFSKICELSFKNKCKIVVDLSSFNIVEENINFFKEVIEKYVSVVFANEEEAKSFTGEKEIEKAIEKIKDKAEIVIVKCGASGSTICHKGELIKISPYKVNPVDTTGAGDSYAAGFLYGLCNDIPIKESGQIASYISSKVVSTLGSNLNEQEWNDIKEFINKINKK